MLTPEQQDRYSRHLLLDGFDQDEIRAAAVRVRGLGLSALWAARYLAASGFGRVVVDDPSWHPELRRLGPWTELSGPAAHEIAPAEAGAGADAALAGAMAALGAIRQALST